jgi:hypothetical protein
VLLDSAILQVTLISCYIWRCAICAFYSSAMSLSSGTTSTAPALPVTSSTASVSGLPDPASASPSAGISYSSLAVAKSIGQGGLLLACSRAASTHKALHQWHSGTLPSLSTFSALKWHKYRLGRLVLLVLSSNCTRAWALPRASLSWQNWSAKW